MSFSGRFKRGESFEQQAFTLLSEQLSFGALGLDTKCVSIARRRKYFSRDRNDYIIFDIGIEINLPKSTYPSLLWLWECKDYSHSVPVNDIEEFYSKLQQVGGANIKGGFITSSSLQSGALAYAKSRGIAVVRVLPAGQVYWELYCMPRLSWYERLRRAEKLRQRHIRDTINALTLQDFSIANHAGVFINLGDKHPHSLTELAGEFLHTNQPRQTGRDNS